jgi:GNAT superfamily N-acetyltransferase
MPLTHDRAVIRAILNTDRSWSAYLLGDLAPGLFEQCEWRCSSSGAPALVLLYRGFQTPVLSAIGEPTAVREILAETGEEPEIYLHIRPEILPPVQARYRDCEAWPMWRMVLEPASFRAQLDAQAVRLGTGDLPALERLYADGAEAGEAPGFFLPRMLAEGVYFGIREGDELVAAAGTHLVVPAEAVGAVGNVYTRRDRRGRGLAGQVTAAVTMELLRQHLLTIVLNVSQANEPAVRVYERLGYQRYCPYYEGLARSIS